MKGLAPPVIELTLTAKEREIILAYRATDDRGQGEISWAAVYQAERWPRRAKLGLHLVKGGAT